jgi:hypothetical protein
MVKDHGRREFRRCYKPGSYKLGGKWRCTEHHQLHSQSCVEALADAGLEPGQLGAVVDAARELCKTGLFDDMAMALNGIDKSSPVCSKSRDGKHHYLTQFGGGDDRAEADQCSQCGVWREDVEDDDDDA